MEKTVIALVVLLLISAHMEGVKPDASDCYDACSTACVNPQKPRESARCDRKCSIRCSPDPDPPVPKPVRTCPQPVPIPRYMYLGTNLIYYLGTNLIYYVNRPIVNGSVPGRFQHVPSGAEDKGY